MYVCICNKVTDSQIREAADEGVRNFGELSARLKVGTCCGRCETCAREVLAEARTQQVSMTQAPGFSLAESCAA